MGRASEMCLDLRSSYDKVKDSCGSVSTAERNRVMGKLKWNVMWCKEEVVPQQNTHVRYN